MVLVLATVAGCGSNRTGATLPSEPLALMRSGTTTPAKHEFVFTCQSALAYECRVYNGDGLLLRTKKKELVDPRAVAAGGDGLLYVANEGARNVLVYTAGARKLLRALDDGGNVPLDVAVFGQTVVTSNLHNATVFLPGATKPSRTLTDQNVLQGSGVAFDPSGNCFWSFTNEQSMAQVDEFTGCKGKPIAVPISAGSPQSMAFDGKGNLWYTSLSTRGPGVYRCTGTSGCQIVYDEFANPSNINFSRDFRDLWVNDPGSGSLYEVDVASGKIVQRITAGLTSANPPAGVASAPGPL